VGTFSNTHAFDYLIEGMAVISEPWTIPKETGSAALRIAKSALDVLTRQASFLIDDLNKMLSTEQAVYHRSVVLQIPVVADEVAQANEPNSHVTKTYFLTRGAPELVAIEDFATQKTPAGTAGTDRFADVVTNKTTLDQFVQQRNAYSPLVPWVASPADCGGAIAAMNNHRGGTQLRLDKRGWESLDATDVTGAWWCDVVGAPIVGAAGKGGAATGPGGSSYSGRDGYGGFDNFGGSLTSPLTLIAANEQYGEGPGTSLSSSSGLQPYLELATQKTPTNGADFNRAPAIAVEVQRTSQSVSTTDRLKIATGRLQVTDGTANHQMRALSSASAYFIRPADASGSAAGTLVNLTHWQRSDNKWEYPSLFNPYWQSSLVDTSVATIEAADVAQSTGLP
jgi:hypothetical protein